MKVLEMLSSTTQPFALGTFSIAGCEPFAGIVRDGRVLAVSSINQWKSSTGVHVSGSSSLLGILDDWERNLAGIAAFLDSQPVSSQADWVDAKSLRTHAPLPRPGQILCTGANYRQHVLDHAADFGGGQGDDGKTADERLQEAREKIDKRARSGLPYAFAKLPSTVVGPFDSIVLPSGIEKPDWELELAVVIGRHTRRVGREDAMKHVAGFTIANDVTARDRLFRPDMRAIASDWLSSKSPPTFMPMGPYFVPACFVEDPQQLRIQLRLNGETMQDAMTSDMIFDIARQIEYCSERVALMPGDVILTGSPAGNGTHFNRFLMDGDEITGSITGIGEMRNRCIAESAASGGAL